MQKNVARKDPEHATYLVKCKPQAFKGGGVLPEVCGEHGMQK
jgi:hypothetical protein